MSRSGKFEDWVECGGHREEGMESESFTKAEHLGKGPKRRRVNPRAGGGQYDSHEAGELGMRLQRKDGHVRREQGIDSHSTQKRWNPAFDPWS